MPDAGVLATILLIVGLCLLGMEFFIPSFGMIGITSVICLIVSVWSAHKAWGGGQNPTFFWTYLGLLVAGVPGSIMGSIWVIQNTALGKGVVLQPPEITPQSNPLENCVGRIGITQNLLTPGGLIFLDGERHHAESVGMLIDPGSEVLVVGVTGNRLVVRPLTPEDRHSAMSSGDSPAGHDPETKSTRSDSRHETLATVNTASESAVQRQSTLPPDAKLDFEIPEDYRA